MLLKFGIEGVKRLVDHVASSVRHRSLPGERLGFKGLFLTAENGVYLQSSGMPMLIANPEEKVDRKRRPFVVNADGCDAEGHPDWWDCQKKAFGVDEAMIPLALDQVLRALGETHLLIVVRSGRITAMGPKSKD